MTRTIRVSTISKSLILLLFLFPVGCTAGQVLFATGIVNNSCCTVKNNTSNAKDTNQSVIALPTPFPVPTSTQNPTPTPSESPSVVAGE